jgi:kanamycin nucleotidyltransferase
MTINPVERRQLALDLCQRFVDTYREQALVCGVYGSVAHGTDTPWSDLDLLFIVDDECPAQGRHLLYRGTAVGYRVYRLRKLLDILTRPSLRWPFHMGVLEILEVLHGEPDRVGRWLELGRSVPVQEFYKALGDALPGLVWESYGRVHSIALRGEDRNLHAVILEVLFEMRTALCLLNRSWVTHDYYEGLVDSFAFERLPDGYRDLVPALFASREPAEAASLADRLVAAFRRLITAEGIHLAEYHTTGKVPI